MEILMEIKDVPAESSEIPTGLFNVALVARPLSPE